MLGEMHRWQTTQSKEALSLAIGMIFGATGPKSSSLIFQLPRAPTMIGKTTKGNNPKTLSQTTNNTPPSCRWVTSTIKWTILKLFTMQASRSALFSETSHKHARTHLWRKTRKSLISWTTKAWAFKIDFQFNWTKISPTHKAFKMKIFSNLMPASTLMDK